MSEPLLQLFSARLVMNEDRTIAMNLAQEDLLYFAKISNQIQNEIEKLKKPIDIPESLPEPEKPVQQEPDQSPINIHANYQEIVEKVMTNYGPVGQKILIEINKQFKA